MGNRVGSLSPSVALNWLRRLVDRFLPSDLGRQLATGAGVVLLIQLGGTGLAYLSHIVLARVLDPAGYGVYAYVMAWAALLAIPAGLGLGTALVRIISQYGDEGASALLRGVAVRSWQLVGGVGTFIALLTSGVIIWWGDRHSIPYFEAILVGIWIVPLLALLDIQVAMGRGLRRMALAYLPGQVVRPLVLLGGIALILIMERPFSPRLALGLTAAALMTTVLLQGVRIGRRVLASTAGCDSEFRTRKWLSISLPMLLVTGFLLLLNRTDVVMLGILAEAEDVGTYNAASRTANLASFILIAVNAIAAPSIASLYHRGDREKLQELASTVAHLIFWPSLAVVIALVTLAPFILGFFGEGFVVGESVLVVLSVGHLVNVGVGSVGYFMVMTGNQDEMAKVVGIAAVVNLALNALAIPLYGAMGAAIATGVSMAAWNIWVNRLVVARISVRPSIVHAVRRLVATGSPGNGSER